MLEELGLGEAQSQDEADVVVFNTCTIREKPDTKFAAYMGDAAARKRERPDMVIAVGGCYAEAQRERLFSLYPSVDVAFGPGTIPHLGEWLGAGGFGVAARGVGDPADERTFAATLPMHRERAVPGLGADLDGLQLDVLVLHRPRRARPRGQPPARRRARRGDAPRGAGRARADAARPERQLVGPRPPAGHPHRVRRAAARLRRRRRDRAHPLHEPAPEGLPPPGDRGDGRVRRGLRARAPAAPVRLDADPEGDAPHVLARALPQARRRHARRHPRSRPLDRHHRRLPRRDRGRLPRDDGGRRGGRASTARSPSSTRRAPAPTPLR